MSISLKENNEWIRIFINEILHLMFKKKDFMGLQSWKFKEEYNIQFYLKDSKDILCSYDNEEIWKKY